VAVTTSQSFSLCPESELEVDELATTEVATQYEGIEADRVENAPHVPGRPRDEVQVSR